MPQGEMKRQREKKKTNGWERRRERRADVCFPRLHSVSLRLPSALHAAEPLWRSQCGDTVAWQRFEPHYPPPSCSHPLQMFSSEVLFRAKRKILPGCPINYWKPAH